MKNTKKVSSLKKLSKNVKKITQDQNKKITGGSYRVRGSGGEF